MRHVTRRIPKPLYGGFSFLYKVWINFKKSGGLLCCSSLSYTLLIAFIPFTISIASVSSFLPVSNELIKDVQFYFFNKFIPQSGEEVYDLFQMSFSRSGHLSVLGLLSLVITCYLMMFTVEYHIHRMWQIKRQRKFINSILLFTGFFIGGPLVVYSIAFVVQQLDLWLHNDLYAEYLSLIASHLVILLSFIAIYKFIPSKSVKWSHACGAGLLASVALFVMHSYFSFSMWHLQKEYALLYGSLAILPIFLLWLYLSVLILLLGAQIIYVVEIKNKIVTK